MRKIIYFIKQSWLILVSAFLFGSLIAIANAAWGPRIEANKSDLIKLFICGRQPDVVGLVQDAVSIQLIEKNYLVTPTTTSDIYKVFDKQQNLIAYAFKAVGSGYADKIELIIAMDPSLSKYLGFRVVASNETPGFGSKMTQPEFRDQFEGAPAQPLDLQKTGDRSQIDKNIVAITGATVTSQAVINIFNTYVEPIKNKLAGRNAD